MKENTVKNHTQTAEEVQSYAPHKVYMGYKCVSNFISHVKQQTL